jgi:hypothetical protein
VEVVDPERIGGKIILNKSDLSSKKAGMQATLAGFAMMAAMGLFLLVIQSVVPDLEEDEVAASQSNQATELGMNMGSTGSTSTKLQGKPASTGNVATEKLPLPPVESGGVVEAV